MDTTEVQEILKEHNETAEEEAEVECNDKLMVDKPKYDTSYFCFNYAGEVDNSKWLNDKVDTHRYNSGRVYLEKEHAELAAQRLKDKLSDDISKTFLWIENWLIRNDDGWRADWNDNTQAKHFIYYNNRDNRWETGYCATYNHNQIVMSEENADKLLEILNK